MVVTNHEREYVKLWSLLSGQLDFTYYSGAVAQSKDIFVMNDKNAIGIADSQSNRIDIVQLEGG